MYFSSTDCVGQTIKGFLKSGSCYNLQGLWLLEFNKGQKFLIMILLKNKKETFKVYVLELWPYQLVEVLWRSNVRLHYLRNRWVVCIDGGKLMKPNTKSIFHEKNFTKKIFLEYFCNRKYTKNSVKLKIFISRVFFF